MASRKEIEELKKNWADNPACNIEHSPGFEDHFDELLAFRQTKEAIWKNELFERRVQEIALLLQMNNLTLARYVLRLEDRIAALEAGGR